MIGLKVIPNRIIIFLRILSDASVQNENLSEKIVLSEQGSLVDFS
jgi:hypothetical protein